MIQPDAEYRHKWRKGDIVRQSLSSVTTAACTGMSHAKPYSRSPRAISANWFFQFQLRFCR